MREAVLLDVADVAEARLLERAPRAAVRLLDGGDDGRDLRVGEDDVARELRRTRGPSPRPTRSGSPISRSTPATLAPTWTSCSHSRVVGDEVRLDHPGRPAVDHDQELAGRPPAFDPGLPLLRSPPRRRRATRARRAPRRASPRRAAGRPRSSGENSITSSRGRRRQSATRASSSDAGAGGRRAGRRRPERRARARARRPARRTGGRARRRAGARRRRRRPRARPRRRLIRSTESSRPADVEPPEPAPEQDEEHDRPGDVHDARSRAGSPRSRAGRKRRRARRSARGWRARPRSGSRPPGARRSARFSISIAPLKARPSENAARQAATTVVCEAREVAALVDDPDDRLGEDGADDARGDQQERDLAQAAPRPSSGSRRSRARVASRASDGKSTVATATENIPCGKM